MLWLGVLAGCEGLVAPERPADFSISVGVETVTVLDAEPGAPLTLYNADGTQMVTIIADEQGQAHFAYIPPEYQVLDPSNFEGITLADGTVLRPDEGYWIQDDSSEKGNWSGTFNVLAVDDIPPQPFYTLQHLDGIEFSALTGAEGDPEDGYQYIEMRDGMRLAAMVRFPDAYIYGDGPYPTVIEYSGYSPSRPDRMDSGTRIANALGFATVSVNMRGTGCSGGVFDVFNRAQHADGYDLVEIVAGQPWVRNNQVGMIGLSYPGISQLYVGSTNPPSLAAIVPLSTIADAWEMQWPGGIYNEGFTRQWVNTREEQSKEGGATWVSKRIEEGDEVCAENLTLSSHSVDFETFLRAMDVRPAEADARDLNQLVPNIETAVFYGGSFQDEQTGAQFGDMMDRFSNARAFRALLSNGRHPDGYSPRSISRWYEFLEFYLSERIPELNPLLRTLGAPEFGKSFKMDEAYFEEDRFTEYESYEAALAAYEAERPIRVLFESGAGQEQPGSPEARTSIEYDSWPTEEALEVEWFFGQDGLLAASMETEEGIDQWRHDDEAGSQTFFGPSGYSVLNPLWDIDWTRFAQGDVLAYQSAPFSSDTVVAGPGYATLWVRSPVDLLGVQVTLTEVRPDGYEFYIQSGWLDFGHREVTVGQDRRLERTFAQAQYSAMPVNEWVSGKVAIPSFAHPIREGSTLRLSVSTPGRDHGTWEFDNPEYDVAPVFELGRGGAMASKVTLSVLPLVPVEGDFPPCPSLRGQPCRTYVPVVNEQVQ